MIKNIIEITELNLDEEVNGFKKVDRNLLKNWTMKVNTILKRIKSINVRETNKLIKARAIFVERKVSLKPNERRGMQWKNHGGKEESTLNIRVRETY